MGRSRAVSVMLWALSENAPNENAPNDRRIFRTQTEVSEFIVSTSGLEVPCDLIWGLTGPGIAARINLGGDSNQRCKCETKGRLTENSKRGQDAKTSGRRPVPRLLRGADPV